MLGSILSQLDMGQSVHGTTGVAECNEVLAMILERWPVARFRVGHMQSVRIALLSHGMSGNKVITIAGLRACSALGILNCTSSQSCFPFLVPCCCVIPFS